MNLELEVSQLSLCSGSGDQQDDAQDDSCEDVETVEWDNEDDLFA